MKNIASFFQTLPATARGGIWMCLACISFALMALCVRIIATDIPPIEIGFFRAFFALLLMVPYAIKIGPGIWKSKNHKAFIARGMTGAGFVMFFFPGVALIEIADAQALTFTTPLFGMVLAMMFLGETFRINRVFALVTGFAGAIIIIRPGLETISVGAILVLCSALCASGSGTLLKYATRSDPPDKVVFFHAIYMTPLIFVGALFDWQWPNLWELLMMLIIAIFATLNQRCLGRAFASTDATAVFPFLFLRLPFGAALGFTFFQEIPTLLVWGGGLVIFGSAFYLARSDSSNKNPSI